MALVPSQYAALKAHILANTNTIDWNAAQVAINTLPLGLDSSHEIAKWYNLPTSPPFWVWRTALTQAEITQKTSRTGTTFTFAGNGLITRSVQELMVWQILFAGSGYGMGTCNPSLVNTRQAFADIFSGAGNAAANRAHLDIVARRPATNIERIYATGTGGDTTGTAAMLVYEGTVDMNDVHNARTS